MGPVVIGIDIGQKHDPTAIAVAEVEERGVNGHREDYHMVRRLERLPLGTPYPAIAQRLTAVVQGVCARVAREGTERMPGALGSVVRINHPQVVNGAVLTVYVDATGVGAPVVDLLAQAGVTPLACYFTHGDRRSVQGRQVSIGKAWLVSRLQALLQTGRILLPRTLEARVLAQELQDFEIKVDQDANDKYGAFRVGTHDDLVTALGLAVQPAPRPMGWS